MTQDLKSLFIAGEYRQVLRQIEPFVKKGDTAYKNLAGECRFRIACGLLSDDRKSIDAAVNELIQAVALRPDWAVYHYYCGLAFERLGNFKKARAAYRAALELEPDNERVFRNLMLCCLKSDQPSLADEVLRSHGSRFANHWLSGLLAARQNAGDDDILKIFNDNPFLSVAESALFAAVVQPPALESRWREWIASTRALVSNSPTLAATSADSKQSAGRRRFLWVACLAGHYLEPENPSVAAALFEELLQAPDLPDVVRDTLVDFCRRMGTTAAAPDESLRWFEHVCRLAPDSVPDRRNYMRALWSVGNHHAGQEEWADALALWQQCDADSPALLRNIVLAKEKLGHNDAVKYRKRLLDAQERALQARPSDRLLRERLALDYQSLLETAREDDQPGLQLTVLKKWHELLADDFDVHEQLAFALMENQQWEAACRHFLALLKQKPDDLDILFYSSLALEEAGRIEEALQRMEHALEIDAVTDWVRRRVAELLTLKAKQRKRREDAYELYERATGLAPGFFPAFAGAAEMRLLTHDKDGARYYLTEYVRNNFLDVLGPVRCAVVYFKHGLKQDGVRLLNNFNRVARDPMQLFSAGEILWQEAPKQAVTYLTRAMKSKKATAELLLNLGEFFSDRNRPEQAVECFGRVLQMEPDNYTAMMSIAMQEYRQGDLAGALQRLEAAKDLALGSDDDEAASVCSVMMRDMKSMLIDGDEPTTPLDYYRYIK